MSAGHQIITCPECNSSAGLQRFVRRGEQMHAIICTICNKPIDQKNLIIQDCYTPLQQVILIIDRHRKVHSRNVEDPEVLLEFQTESYAVVQALETIRKEILG